MACEGLGAAAPILAFSLEDAPQQAAGFFTSESLGDAFQHLASRRKAHIMRAVKTMASIQRISPEERHRLFGLLNDRSASDAFVAYYALEHPADRVVIHGYFSGGKGPSGFMVVAQTGMDLFRPIAVPFVATPTSLHQLLRASLQPQRPVLLYLPLEQREWAEQLLDFQGGQVAELMRLDPRAYEPMINVLVRESSSPLGTPRYEIQSRSGASAATGVNWQGQRYAEVYLQADEEAQTRGLALSVLAAISSRLLREHTIPLFRHDESSLIRLSSLERLGFRGTGSRTFIAQALINDPQTEAEK